MTKNLALIALAVVALATPASALSCGGYRGCRYGADGGPMFRHHNYGGPAAVSRDEIRAKSHNYLAPYLTTGRSKNQ